MYVEPIFKDVLHCYKHWPQHEAELDSEFQNFCLMLELMGNKYVGSIPESQGSQAGFWMQSYTLAHRSFQNVSQGMGYYWVWLAMCIYGFFVCIVVRVICYRVGNSYASIIMIGQCSLTLQIHWISKLCDWTWINNCLKSTCWESERHQFERFNVFVSSQSQ